MAAVLLLAVCLGGCTTPSPSGPSSSAPSPTSSSGGPGPASSSSPPPAVGRFGGTGVRLSGELRNLTRGFSANLSAYNDGPGEVRHGLRYVCVPEPGSWGGAGLSGPPGDGLRYQRPNQYRLGCPATSNRGGDPVPVGAYVNWTFAGRDAGQCTTAGVCDNVWDGNLTAADGTRGPAPPGTYTWRFAFSWNGPDGDDHSGTVALDVVVP